ncbi:MAG: TetR/AcrR family transcriptional regulator [Spirochaetes bacterium]|nr:TetR/AcrR family transcriptional regulator [Spirochaetota bacterium]
MDDKTKKLIYKKAVTLFKKNGFKKTGVAQIAESAGIAVGSFYKLYPAKEHLFLEIFADVNLKYEKNIIETETQGKDPEDYIIRIIRRLLDALTSDPILKIWSDREQWHKIIGKCRGSSIGLQEDQISKTMFVSIIKNWQQQGIARTDMEPDFILAMFDSLLLAHLYREDIGAQHFPALIDTMARFITRGILVHDKRGRS